MPHFVQGTVSEIIAERAGLQKVRVTRTDDGPGDRAYVLSDLIGRVAAGDTVVLNTTAVELGLGTGGWHFVHWNLTRAAFNQPGPGHIMKLRYTSLQTDTGATEETLMPVDDLAGIPVIGCTLLSQAALAALAYRRARPDDRVALVVSDQASLPLVLSDLVHEMVEQGVVDRTITAGHAFGGQLEAVNTASALGVARADGADAIIVTEGFGVVGTGSSTGFSGFEIASALWIAQRLRGTPVLAVRYSDADGRERHRGVSHHTRTILECTDGFHIGIPSDTTTWTPPGHTVHAVTVDDVEHLIDMFGSSLLTTMGRTYAQDPGFFHYAAAAGIAAATLTSFSRH